MTKPQNEKPGFIHVSDSKIIGNTGYIITNDVTFTHMGKALVFYFEVWSNFQTFKNKTAGHVF